MATARCPYCGEEKPSTGLLGHIMLTAGAEHGTFGSVPADYEDARRTDDGARGVLDPDQDIQLSRSPDEIGAFRWAVLYVLDSVSLSMALAGLVLVVGAAVFADGEWAAVLALLGGLTTAVSLVFFVGLLGLKRRRS